jgi:hypothetical protein
VPRRSPAHAGAKAGVTVKQPLDLGREATPGKSRVYYSGAQNGAASSRRKSQPEHARAGVDRRRFCLASKGKC